MVMRLFEPQKSRMKAGAGVEDLASYLPKWSISR